MKTIRVLLLGLALIGVSAHAQRNPAAAASAVPPLPLPASAVAPAPAPGGLFAGDPSPLFGARKAVQLDPSVVLGSRSVTFTVDGKAYQFEGSLRRDPDGRVVWESDFRLSQKMRFSYETNGIWGGTFYVDGRVFLMRGEGTNGVIVEAFTPGPQFPEDRDTKPPSRAASAPR